MSNAEYRWDSPLHWLEETARTWDAPTLYQALMVFANAAGNDEVQDEFQSDMVRDGYFDEADTDDEEREVEA